jgi:hypothetical protein
MGLCYLNADRAGEDTTSPSYRSVCLGLLSLFGCNRREFRDRCSEPAMRSIAELRWSMRLRCTLAIAT